MNGKRKQHTAEFRFKVALEALKGLKTVAELASIYEVHPTLINRWKKELHEDGRTIFGSPKRKGRETEVLQAALYEEIGRLKFELDWLKKKAAPFSGGQPHHDGVVSSPAQCPAAV
jgi:transposase-like protein